MHADVMRDATLLGKTCNGSVYVMLMLLSSMGCWYYYLACGANAKNYELTDSSPNSLGY